MINTREKRISLDPYEIRDQISQAIINGAIHLAEDMNRFTYINEMIYKTLYKGCTSVCLKHNSQYRHMWE